MKKSHFESDSFNFFLAFEKFQTKKIFFLSFPVGWNVGGGLDERKPPKRWKTKMEDGRRAAGAAAGAVRAAAGKIILHLKKTTEMVEKLNCHGE